METLLNHPFVQATPELAEKLAFIFSRHGQICSFATRRPLKMRKEFGHVLVEKEAKYICRVGLNYEAMAVTQEIRESGKEASGLIGREWVSFPHILRGIKSGKFLLRIYAVDPLKGLRAKEKHYFLDGKKTEDIEQVKTMCLASEFANRDVFTPTLCMDFPLDSITGINGEK